MTPRPDRDRQPPAPAARRRLLFPGAAVLRNPRQRRHPPQEDRRAGLADGTILAAAGLARLGIPAGPASNSGRSASTGWSPLSARGRSPSSAGRRTRPVRRGLRRAHRAGGRASSGPSRPRSAAGCHTAFARARRTARPCTCSTSGPGPRRFALSEADFADPGAAAARILRESGSSGVTTPTCMMPPSPLAGRSDRRHPDPGPGLGAGGTAPGARGRGPRASGHPGRQGGRPQTLPT